MNSKQAIIISGIGNAIVDVLSYVNEETLKKLDLQKGSMQLCTEDFQKIVLNETSTQEISPGGSVANSIATLAALNISSSFSAAIGKDLWGDAFEKSLLDCGVNLNLEVNHKQPTGKSIILITPDSERTMNTCLGASENNNANFFALEHLGTSKYLFVEGYLLSSDIAWQNIVDSLPLLKKQNTKVILTLSDSICVSSYRSRFRYLIDESDLVFANSKEIAALWSVGEESIDFASPLPSQKPYTLVVTRSERGASVFSSNKVTTIKANKIDNIVDLTGAGDQFAAGYIFGVLSNWDIKDCAKFGNELASKIIAQVGPRFKKEESESIWSKFAELNSLPKKVANVR